MNLMFKFTVALGLFLSAHWTAMAQEAKSRSALPASPFPVSEPITLQTGDTFIQGGIPYHMYGVQSCIRGTVFRTIGGVDADCGALSMAMLSEILRLDVACQPIGTNGAAIQVVCAGRSDGSTLDVGEVLIASGFAFAAMERPGVPIVLNYAAAEQSAATAKIGLWSGKFIHPVVSLSQSMQAR